MEGLALAINAESHKESWHNLDNKKFCEKLSLHGFLELLEVSGLTLNPDINSIYDYITNADSILEIGGGYGRVINACQQLGYKKKLTAIEYAHSYVNFLKEHIKKCEIIEGDFLSYFFKAKFDLILMLWTTIAMFSPDEQVKCLNKCAKLLKTGGFCVIDLLISNSSNNIKTAEAKEYCVSDQEKSTDCHFYMPTTFEIIKAAATAGLCVRQTRDYIAGTAARCLVILSK